MRGGMLVHGQSGKRMEPDLERGIRVSRMDLAQQVRGQAWSLLQGLELGHPRVLEALILASKVAATSGIVAEVCRSDDPEYTTGYVASRELGYVRILNMKGAGDPLGGRVFFVDGTLSVEQITRDLEKSPCLISEISRV